MFFFDLSRSMSSSVHVRLTRKTRFLTLTVEHPIDVGLLLSIDLNIFETMDPFNDETTKSCEYS